YAGPTLNRCGRLLAAAHGGQVLVSRPARDLSIDALTDRATFRDLGSHRMRGIERPLQVFQLEADGPADEVPPLPTLDGTPHNLPPQFTSFVGREADREAVADLVVTNPIVTVTGSGGCGKTRLAVEVGTDLLERFDDGVWFADLAAAADESAVMVAVAAALSLSIPRHRPVRDAVAEHLADRRAPPLLDHHERVLDACAQALVGRPGAGAGAR